MWQFCRRRHWRGGLGAGTRIATGGLLDCLAIESILVRAGFFHADAMSGNNFLHLKVVGMDCFTRKFMTAIQILSVILVENKYDRLERILGWFLTGSLFPWTTL